MTHLLDNFSEEHKNLKLFKQLIKQESKALELFLKQTILISRQYNYSLFDGIHYSLSKFQYDLQNQYILLKQLGKQFQKIKQEIKSQYIYIKAQTCFQNKMMFDIREFDETDMDTNNQIKNKQDYQMIQIEDIIRKEKCLIMNTNSIIQLFQDKHDLRLINCQQSSDKMNVYLKQNSKKTILSNQTIESILINSSVLDNDSSFEKQLLKESQFNQFFNDQIE